MSNLKFLPLHIPAIPACKKSAIRLVSVLTYSSQSGRADHVHCCFKSAVYLFFRVTASH